MLRLQSDIERICRLGLDSRALRSQVIARLSADVVHDAFCFATIDPWTLLISDDLSDGIPPGNGELASRNEYLVPDVDKFADLARTRRTIGILSHSTGGDSRMSERLRTVLPVIDARDELRAVFLADGECWGALSLFRRGSRARFTQREAELLRALSRPVARALRRACAETVSAAFPGPSSPGVLVLDGEGRTLTANETAQCWLDEIGTLPPFEVSAAARAGRGDEAYLRVRSRAGRWLSLWGSPLAGDPHSDTSVVIQPTPVSGITATLAPYTVQDHLKSVFAKFGVRSRGELVAHALGIAPTDASPG